MKYDNPHMSVHSPRMGNRLTRAMGSLGLKLTGWELTGKMPDVPKFVIIGAPHTSHWDALYFCSKVESQNGPGFMSFFEIRV